MSSDAIVEGSEAPRSVRQFLTLCLLGAREEAGFPSNEDGYDEDVNVYVVGLLERFLSRAYHEQSARYVHAYDQDLAREARRGGDARHTFRLYKANADHLLLDLGIFRRANGIGREGDLLLDRPVADFCGRGGTYYRVASSTLRRLRRQRSAQEAALAKLGDGFESYVSVLHRVRSSYFHLTERLSAGSLFHLSQDTLTSSDEDHTQLLYDRFLDAYSAYRSDASPAQRSELAAAVEELRAADPDFAFAMPD